MLKTILIISENKYLSLIKIDDSLIPYQNWNEYFYEKYDISEDGFFTNYRFELGEKYSNLIIYRNENGEYDEFNSNLHYPYFDTSTVSIKYDEAKYQKELESYNSMQEKQNELAELNKYFDWYNTQAVQYLSGRITSSDFQALQEEYLENADRALKLKQELGIPTESQLREALLAKEEK